MDGRAAEASGEEWTLRPGAARLVAHAWPARGAFCGSFLVLTALRPDLRRRSPGLATPLTAPSRRGSAASLRRSRWARVCVCAPLTGSDTCGRSRQSDTLIKDTSSLEKPPRNAQGFLAQGFLVVPRVQIPLIAPVT